MSPVVIESNLEKQTDAREEYQYKRDLSNEYETERHLAVDKLGTLDCLKTYSCVHCDYKTNKRRCFASHFKNKHSNDDKKYKCSQCPFETSSKHGFEVHLTIHSRGNDKKLKCTVCDYRTNRELLLKQHVLSKHTEVKEYKCPHCKYETNDKHYIKRHLVMHENVRPYECEVCRKRFKWRSNLRMHGRAHSEKNNFHCANCNFKTKWKSSLACHLRETHVTEKEKDGKDLKCVELGKAFECHVCLQRFPRKYSLQRHVGRKHVNEKEYRCSKCRYKTFIETELKLHTKEHNLNDKLLGNRARKT